MTEISKCKGDGCPVRGTCYRFTAPGDLRYQAFLRPDAITDRGCAHYWPTKEVKQ